MSVPIVTRKQWGATPWENPVTRVAMTEKRYFLVHYHGGKPAAQRGVYVPRNVERIHLDNGWSGVGYNFMVDLDGIVYEGRGWDGVGAQCPGRNRDGVGVYVAVGGDQQPTQAALRSVKALRDELKVRTGVPLETGWHGRYYATACAGPVLIPWVKAGMPLGPTGGMGAPITTTPTPVPVPPPTPTASLVIDGAMGPATIRRWQKVMGTTIDGVISQPSSLVRTVQRALNARGANLVVDGLGIRSNNDGDVGPTATIRALQRHLGTTVDGVLSHPASYAVKALQRRLNEGKF